MNKIRLRRNLHRWYADAARDLPWRNSRDPYAVMVSEFMLQQTQVATVIDYFRRWMKRFPTVRDLADAAEAEVMSEWQGLGYYSRCRNLHAAARAISARHGGVVPGEFDALVALPGVGRYTAAAVLAFAFGRNAPVVDANVARVLARLTNFQDLITTSAAKAHLESVALDLGAGADAAMHHSAIMELGALVCRAGTPTCAVCPVRQDCEATEPIRLPVKPARRAVTQVHEQRGFALEDGKIFLLHSDGPRWNGMWILPEVKQQDGVAEHVEVYPITRYRVTMEVFRMSASELPECKSISMDEFEKLAMPAPHRRALTAVLSL